MSLIRTNSLQLGQSTTPTQNFTLSVPSVSDGTVKLARGNSGATTADILTVNASGDVGIGTAAPLSTTATRTYLALRGSEASGVLQLQTNAAGSTLPNIGIIEWALPDNTSSSSLRVSFITSITEGATANNRGSVLTFGTKADGVTGGGIERMRIDSSGNVGIGLTPNASRNNTRLQIVDGIGFPATQVASSDAKTLDDYEEGTWTPQVFIGTTQQTVGAATGTYTKIGNIVFIACRVEAITKSGTGDLTLRNLPFAPNITGIQNKYPQFLTRYDAINAAGLVMGLTSGSTSHIEFQNIGTTGGYSGTTNNTHIGGVFSLYGVSGFYYT